MRVYYSPRKGWSTTEEEGLDKSEDNLALENHELKKKKLENRAIKCVAVCGLVVV